MFRYQFGGQCHMENPPYQMIGVEPRTDMPGKAGFQITLPWNPPMNIIVLFDRDAAEEFLHKFREAMDVGKGLKR